VARRSRATAELTFTGAPELHASLDRLGELGKGFALLDGVQAGGTVLRREIAARAGSTLAPHIGLKVTKTKDARVVAIVGPVTRAKVGRHKVSATSLAVWREYGTKAHEITAGYYKRKRLTRAQRAAGVSSRKSDKRALVVRGSERYRSVQHKGARAFPFMRPGFDAGAPRALAAAGGAVWDRLTGDARMTKDSRRA
jgi:hypothetical protein